MGPACQGRPTFCSASTAQPAPSTARFSSSLVIVERPSMSASLAFSYSSAFVGSSPDAAPEPADGSARRHRRSTCPVSSRKRRPIASRSFSPAFADSTGSRSCSSSSTWWRSSPISAASLPS